MKFHNFRETDLIQRAFVLLNFLVVVFAMSNKQVYATNALRCDNVDYESANILHIVCPIARGVNILMFSSGAVFVIMLFIGGYKYATALGDPQGAQGANLTLTYAVVGLVLIVGTYTIFVIIANILGIDYTSTGGAGVNLDFFGAIQDGICYLLTKSTENEPIVKNLNCATF